MTRRGKAPQCLSLRAAGISPSRHCESHTAFGGDIAIESANIADLRSKMRHFLSRSKSPSDAAI